MTTKEAFEIFLNDPHLVAKTYLTPTHKRALRRKLKADELGHDAMQKWLIQAGFTEKIDWKAPPKRLKIKKPVTEMTGV